MNPTTNPNDDSTDTDESCDNPNCDGDKEVVTPEGYLCEKCASELASELSDEAEL